MRNMVWLREKNVCLCVHTAKAPSDAEWGTWMELLRQVPPRELRILVVTDGGAPNVHHRAQLTDYMAGAEPAIAVVSTSMAVKGVATAISWFNKRIKAFDPSAIDKALDHVGFAHGERAGWLERAATLAAELSAPVDSLTKAVGSAARRER